ncbi:hypothetical protein [Sorangium sp. So ce176]|uniref:hypothetical protein n=1 Tax=Sorangium sp. So ce176 TaxID=3133286 RepID=UPI003F5F097E
MSTLKAAFSARRNREMALESSGARSSGVPKRCSSSRAAGDRLKGADAGAQREDVVHPARDEPVARIDEAVHVLEDGRVVQEVRCLELGELRHLPEDEERVIGAILVEGPDELHVERRVVVHGVAGAAGAAVALERLVEEDARARADVLGDEPGHDARILRALGEPIHKVNSIYKCARRQAARGGVAGEPRPSRLGWPLRRRSTLAGWMPARSVVLRAKAHRRASFSCYLVGPRREHGVVAHDGEVYVIVGAPRARPGTGTPALAHVVRDHRDPRRDHHDAANLQRRQGFT